MRKLAVCVLILLFLLLSACGYSGENYDIVATTLPVYDFTAILCEGTDLSVGRLVTESVSCLHDYTLKVDQMRMIEGADLVVISGAGLEGFLDDALSSTSCLVDASTGVHTHSGGHSHDAHDDHDEHEHHHETDPHIWLSVENAKHMAENICEGLTLRYPEQIEIFEKNLSHLLTKLDAVQAYGKSQLSDLSCRKLITFHDGFAYLAESFDLSILEAIEEESGSEASAAEIIHLTGLVKEHNLPAVFTEVSGSDACAGIIKAEAGIQIYALDMAMSGDSYFDAMYHNIDTIKEALK